MHSIPESCCETVGKSRTERLDRAAYVTAEQRRVQAKVCVLNHSTYRRAKVVPNLMSEGDVRHLGRDMRGVVLHSDDTSVQRLPLPVRVQFALLTDAPRASCGSRIKHITVEWIIRLFEYWTKISERMLYVF